MQSDTQCNAKLLFSCPDHDPSVVAVPCHHSSYRRERASNCKVTMRACSKAQAKLPMMYARLLIN